MIQDVRGMVDPTNGRIDRKIFSDEEIYRQEMVSVFGRAWLLIGHESQIPNVGDFFVSRMGEDSVILTRDKDGVVRVLLNTCRHRGMRVCRYDEGNTKRFYCPYHAWTYGLDGELVSVPNYPAVYDPPFDLKAWGLKQPAQVASFRGFVWATWDADAPSFDDYLGDLRQSLWEGLGPWDGGDGEIEVLPGVQKWIVPCNWKIVAENFAGDPLHEPSHASVNQVRLGPSGRRDALGEIYMTYFPEGHGWVVEEFDHTLPRQQYAASPATSAYYEACWRKRVERLGERAGAPLVLGTIYPNASIHTQQPRTILFAHPKGPDKTEMWRMYYVDKSAPQEVKDYLRHYYIAYSGPAGITEQDDMENWISTSEGTETPQASTLPFNYMAGLGMEVAHPRVPGVVSAKLQSEQNTRNFYKRWADYMSSTSWEQLKAEATR